MSTSDILKDIEEMNSILDQPVIPEEVKDEKVESKEEKSEGNTKEEILPIEAKEEVKEEAKVEPEVKPDEKKVEPPVDERDKAIADLRAELAVLKAEKVVERLPEKKVEEKKVEPPVIEEQDFVGEIDLDEVTREPKELNKLLNNIYRKARTDSEQALIQKLPELVSTHVEIVNTLKKTSEDFYRANEDLKSFPKVVKVVFDDLVQQNPNRTYEDVMKDVATETRKRLGLAEPKAKEEVKEEPKKESKAPKLPSKESGAGRPGSKSETESDTLQSQIEEMNKAIGG